MWKFIVTVFLGRSEQVMAFNIWNLFKPAAETQIFWKILIHYTLFEKPPSVIIDPNLQAVVFTLSTK